MKIVANIKENKENRKIKSNLCDVRRMDVINARQNLRQLVAVEILYLKGQSCKLSSSVLK